MGAHSEESSSKRKKRRSKKMSRLAFSAGLTAVSAAIDFGRSDSGPSVALVCAASGGGERLGDSSEDSFEEAANEFLKKVHEAEGEWEER